MYEVVSGAIWISECFDDMGLLTIYSLSPCKIIADVSLKGLLLLFRQHLDICEIILLILFFYFSPLKGS